LLKTLQQRLKTPHAPVRVTHAPGAGGAHGRRRRTCARFRCTCRHGQDGAPYISASLDYALFPGSGFTNVGCRRIMLRGPRQAGIDLIAPSDLRAIYLDARGARRALPGRLCGRLASGGFHRRVTATPPMNELEIIGALRAAPVPIVKCVEQRRVGAGRRRIRARRLSRPARHTEPEGPYGEYVGYYGVVKAQPRVPASPPSPTARTRCSRPRPSAAATWRAPTPRSSPR